MISALFLAGRILFTGCERIVVNRLGQNTGSLSGAFVYFGTATFFLLPCLFFVPSPRTFHFLGIAAASGFVYSFAFWLFVKSLSSEDVSLVAPLYHFNVFFLMILAAIFLNETFTFGKFSGLVLLVYGTTFLKKARNPVLAGIRIFKDRACLMMIGCSLLMAIGRTIDGYMVRLINPVYYAFFIYFYISLFLFVFHIPARRLRVIFQPLIQKPGIAILSGALNAFSYLFLLFAVKDIEMSVAEPLSMLGMVVTVLLARIILNESIQGRIAGVFIMIGGAWLLLLL